MPLVPGGLDALGALDSSKLEFYGSRWKLNGLKTDLWVRRQLLSITGIRGIRVLLKGNAIREIAVGERLSCGLKRHIERVEDLVFCLPGKFQVNLHIS
jgi:hypothetical protein